MTYSIGADVGGNHISVGLFEHLDKVIQDKAITTKKVNRLASREEILSDWAEAIRSAQKAVSHPIRGVGLAMPGPFDYYHGISLITGVDKFESLYGVNVRRELSQRLHVDPANIRFINDASAFSVAECWMGKASTFTRCVGITLGTGLGSTFTEQGKPVFKREDVPAGGFLYDKPFQGVPADELFSTRGLISRYFAHSGIRCENVLQIYSRASSDPRVKETFSEFGHELGAFMLPYLQKFKAEIVVLGGNICGAFPLFEQSLREQLTGLPLYVSGHGEKAAMIGAARLLDDNYYSEIAQSLKDM